LRGDRRHEYAAEMVAIGAACVSELSDIGTSYRRKAAWPSKQKTMGRMEVLM
jgi:hypothetical protein